MYKIDGNFKSNMIKCNTMNQKWKDIDDALPNKIVIETNNLLFLN
jgi:hypothetical protein